MRYRQTDHALACVGAVIGAGFASGREVMSFFSQYGAFSWGLILLATGTMSAICVLTMNRVRGSSHNGLHSITDGNPIVLRRLGEGCIFLLMAVTGGAMLSAAGELVALMLPIHGAYEIGLLFTLLAAWGLAQRSIKPLAMISGVLLVAILVAYVIMMGPREPGEYVRIERTMTVFTVLKASLFAVAYGCMNMAIALGVVCQCAKRTARGKHRTAALFGFLLTILFLLCNFVLLRHEELRQTAFPIVQLLNGLGRAGFLFSAVILYLAVLTTAIAILCTLRGMAGAYTKSDWAIHGLTVGAPFLFSFIGFGQIVEDLYAPMGLACLALVFLPALWTRRKERKTKAPIAQ